MSHCCHHDCRQGRDCPLRGLVPTTTHDAQGITVTEWRARSPRDCAELGVRQGRVPACEGRDEIPQAEPEFARPANGGDIGDRIAAWAQWLMVALAMLSVAALLHDILTQAMP